MKKQMHLAAQYLAAAGISFLEKKADDSHTNLGFNIEDSALETHMLSENGDQLCLSYKDFSLQWKSKSGTASFDLDGATHQEVLSWLTEASKVYLNKEYTYNLHYDLPYDINDSFIFQLKSIEELEALVQLRTMAQLSLEKINKEFKKNTDIRIWPHHFDTGIYSQLLNNNLYLGLGLAIPDSLSDYHYLYISGYKENNTINPSHFSSLKKGEWKIRGFKGAILTALHLTEADAVYFFKEAINQYK